MDLNSYIGNIVVATVLTGLALFAEHVALWERPWRLTRPAAYVVGVTTLLLGSGVWAWQQSRLGPIDPWLATFAFAIISGGSGLGILIAYWVRGVRSVIERNGKTKQQISEVLDDGPLGDLRRN